MRHTAATLWLASGEAPEWIARQLGHTTTEMLFRVYSRYVPNLTRNDGSAMDRLRTNTFVATPVQPTQPTPLPSQMPVSPPSQENVAPPTPTPTEVVGTVREVRAVPVSINADGMKPESQPPPISWADMANSWKSNDSSFDTAA